MQYIYSLNRSQLFLQASPHRYNSFFLITEHHDCIFALLNASHGVSFQFSSLTLAEPLFPLWLYYFHYVSKFEALEENSG